MFSTQAALRDLETHCATCTAPPPVGGPPWHRCGRCGVPSYCSRECQLTAWKRCEHRRSCGQQSLPTVEPLPDANGAPQLHTAPYGSSSSSSEGAPLSCVEGARCGLGGTLDILREWYAFAWLGLAIGLGLGLANPNPNPSPNPRYAFAPVA